MFDQILQKNNFIWLLLNKSCKSPSTKVNEGTLNLAELKQDDLQKTDLVFLTCQGTENLCLFVFRQVWGFGVKLFIHIPYNQLGYPRKNENDNTETIYV